MTQPANPFKIGIFVLAGLAAATVAAVAVGADAVGAQTIVYHTFFDESVQGLETGAPVKYRGVTIGIVAAIDIAPDHRHIDVVERLRVSEIRRMGLTEQAAGHSETRFIVPDNLRAQLGSQGITGVKFVLIDFFDVNANPLPDLPFPTPRHYLPAAASLMKTLEDTFVRTLDRLPDAVESLDAVLRKVDRLLQDVEKERLPEQATATLKEATSTLVELRDTLRSVSSSGLPDRAGRAIDSTRVAVEKLSALIEQVGAEHGVLAAASRAADAVYGFGKAANGQTRDLGETLRDVDEAARAVRDLADELQRDPDMLLKGRTKPRNP